VTPRHAGRGRRCGEPAGLGLERRRRQAAARRGRPRRLAWRGWWRGSRAAAGQRSGQAEQSLLPGVRGRRDRATAAGQRGGSRCTRSRLLGRQAVKNVEVRTRLVAHRCCSLCSFSLTRHWRLVLVGPWPALRALSCDEPRRPVVRMESSKEPTGKNRRVKIPPGLRVGEKYCWNFGSLAPGLSAQSAGFGAPAVNTGGDWSGLR